MNYPEPNRHDVYSKNDAQEYVYEDSRIYLTVHIIQIKTNCWLQAVSYDKKIESVGTMGMGTPLMKIRGAQKQSGKKTRQLRTKQLNAQKK